MPAVPEAGKMPALPGAGEMPAPQAPGTVLASGGGRLVIAAGRGAVAVEGVQPAGKRMMRIEEFLRGHAVRAGERFGPEGAG